MERLFIEMISLWQAQAGRLERHLQAILGSEAEWVWEAFARITIPIG